MLGALQLRLKDDNTDLLKFKQSVGSDIQIAIKKMHTKVEGFQHRIETGVHLAAKHEEMIAPLLEANMIDNLLQGQEAEDKKRVSLFGLKTYAHAIRDGVQVASLFQLSKNSESQTNVDKNVVSPQATIKPVYGLSSSSDAGDPTVHRHPAAIEYPSHF